MKKTPLRRKTPLRAKKSLKGTTSRKPAKKRARVAKQPSQKLLNKKLWEECKRLTRERWGNRCFTCGKYPLSGSNWHTGHCKPKGALPLRFKYDVRGLRPQCYNCNINLFGATDIFVAKLEQHDEGLQFLNESCYFDPEANAWRIRQDVPMIGGKDATIFKQNLTKLYKTVSYETTF
jgi:hypothetical protein